MFNPRPNWKHSAWLGHLIWWVRENIRLRGTVFKFTPISGGDEESATLSKVGWDGVTVTTKRKR